MPDFSKPRARNRYFLRPSGKPDKVVDGGRIGVFYVAVHAKQSMDKLSTCLGCSFHAMNHSEVVYAMA